MRLAKLTLFINYTWYMRVLGLKLDKLYFFDFFRFLGFHNSMKPAMILARKTRILARSSLASLMWTRNLRCIRLLTVLDYKLVNREIVIKRNSFQEGLRVLEERRFEHLCVGASVFDYDTKATI
jgi:hypothetical protein